MEGRRSVGEEKKRKKKILIIIQEIFAPNSDKFDVRSGVRFIIYYFFAKYSHSFFSFSRNHRCRVETIRCGGGGCRRGKRLAAPFV